MWTAPASAAGREVPGLAPQEFLVAFGRALDVPEGER